MNITETTALLARASQIDARVEVTEQTVEAWHDMIGDLRAEDVAAAIRTHYRNTTDRVMPADVRKLVNGAPDAGRQARKWLDEPLEGVKKPEWFDAEVEKWRKKAAETGRHCHCAHHDKGWANEPYWNGVGE